MTTATFTITPSPDFCQKNPALLRQANTLAESYESGQEIIEDTRLKAIGSNLWDALDISARFSAEKQQVRLSGTFAIVIESDQGDILNLPWETLHHPEDGFLAREEGFSLTRRMPKVQTGLPDVTCEPLRILLFTSLPDNLSEQGRLDIEAEQAAVQEALNVAEAEGRIELEMPDDGRLESFRDTLHSFHPHLVWMSGHGEFNHDLTNDKAEGRFVFEDQWGDATGISEQELAKCFRGVPSVHAVILSACQSAKPHPAHPDNGLAQTLHNAGVPHVIGMRESVFDKAATRFAQAFLAALVHDKQPQRIEQALQTARREIIEFAPGTTRYHHSDPQRQTVSMGQWCLPQQLSQSLDHDLIDWSFTPKPPQRSHAYKETFQDIAQPKRFIGRRRELRQWQNALLRNNVSQLMIIGAGGMGKTALAGKLLKTLEKGGFEVYSLSLRKEHNWQHSIERMVNLLDEKNQELYQRELALATTSEQPTGLLARFKQPVVHIDEYQRAKALLSLLLEQHQRKLALLLDNLETKQDENQHHITDPDLQCWVKAAQELVPQGLRLLLTSRWQLPDWNPQWLFALGKPLYGDYLAYARQLQLPKDFMADKERQHKVWDTLGGNFRALEFFAKTTGTMNRQEENDFLLQLKQASVESQVDMALAKVYGQCDDNARELLSRMRAYQHPVDMEGIKSIALPDLKQAERPVEKLLAVSLLERYEHPTLGMEYQVSPLVRDWLEQQVAIEAVDITYQQMAARYLLGQWDKDKKTDWKHLINTHQALISSGLTEAGHQLVLDWVVGPLNNAGRYQELISNWLPPLLNTDKEPLRGAALGAIGKQHLHVGDYDTALKYLKQSLQIQQEIGDKSGEGTTLNNMATTAHARGDYDTALKYLKQSLQIRQEIGDKSGEGTTLNNISQIFKARGDYDTALKYLKQSLQIQQEIGDKSGEGTTLNNISQIYDARGDYDTALKYLKQSLQIRQEIGDKSGEGTTLNNMATTAHARGDYDTALKYLKQSLQIQQEIGDKSGEGTTLNNISQIYDARGDYDTALKYLKQSLQIRQEIGDKSGEGTTLNNMATTAHARGDYDTALKYLKQSLQIQQEIGDKSGEGTTLNNISQIFKARGDYDTALKYLKQSLQIQQEIGDKSGEGTTLNNISQIYDARGDYDTALKYLKQSLQIRQEIGDKSGEGTTLNNMATTAHARGDYDTALKYLKQSLQIQQEIGDKSGEGTTLNNISQIFKARGDYDTALKYLKQSLQIQQEIGDVAGLCATLFNMGFMHHQNDEVKEAVSAWLTVYQLAKKMNLAQALDALENLAPQLGLEGGLAGWEQLAQQHGME